MLFTSRITQIEIFQTQGTPDFQKSKTIFRHNTKQGKTQNKYKNQNIKILKEYVPFQISPNQLSLAPKVSSSPSSPSPFSSPPKNHKVINIIHLNQTTKLSKKIHPKKYSKEMGFTWM